MMACSVAVGSPTPNLLIPTAAAVSALDVAAAFQLPSSSPFRPPTLPRRPRSLRVVASSSTYPPITSSSSPAPTADPDDQPCCSTATRDQPARLKRKRPARLDMSTVDPAVDAAAWAVDTGRVNEVQADGATFAVYSKRGRARAKLEDRYVAAVEEQGDTTSAAAAAPAPGRKPSLFGVFDGHGGPAAAEFVSANIKTHLFSHLPTASTTTTPSVADAVKAAYLSTDAALLASVPNGGTCAVTALITHDNRLVVSHAGDCRAVLCRAGEPHLLTADHRPGRPDERDRIEALGGYVDCHRGGVWRLHGSLAVSRGFGDRHLKDWVSAEPETTVLDIQPDCHFLLMASDGLWEKVSHQEAVAIASRPNSAADACKALADLAVARGSMDDVTVMIVNLDAYASS